MYNPFKRLIDFKPQKRIIKPRVSFKVSCERSKLEGYAGFELKNETGANRGIVVCPVCNHPYNLRIKKSDIVGNIFKVGSRHLFTITAIKLEETERDF